MMSFIRQLTGKSRRDAEADALKEEATRVFHNEGRKVEAKRLTLERLVSQIKKDLDHGSNHRGTSHN